MRPPLSLVPCLGESVCSSFSCNDALAMQRIKDQRKCHAQLAGETTKCLEAMLELQPIADATCDTCNKMD